MHAGSAAESLKASLRRDVVRYFLMYLIYSHAAKASRRTVIIQSDELLNPVFLAMDGIVSRIVFLRET